MNFLQTASAVMVGVLSAQITYNLLRYSFYLITGLTPQEAFNNERNRATKRGPLGGP